MSREERYSRAEDGSGSPVPEAMTRLLALLEGRVGPEKIDRVWVFPPLVKGRREWGLVAVGCFDPSPSQRTLMTARYTAELTGEGMTFEPELVSEGTAPAERLRHIMDGVVRRSDLPLGTPREFEISGSRDRFLALQREHAPGGGPEVGPER